MTKLAARITRKCQQVDAQRVDSRQLQQGKVPFRRRKVRFIEAHRGVLQELLDLSLPAEAIAAERTGISQFCSCYGFLDKPLRIRFRVLDELIKVLPGPTLPDVTLDAESFARLDIPVTRVFITENETNFLAFPAVAGAIVIFGAGGGEDEQVIHDLPRLADAELALFNELRDNRIGTRLRLEQERVGFQWLKNALDAVPLSPKPDKPEPKK